MTLHALITWLTEKRKLLAAYAKSERAPEVILCDDVLDKLHAARMIASKLLTALGTAKDELAIERATVERLRAALREIEDEDDSCSCPHSTEDCCAKILVFCARCYAAAALASADPDALTGKPVAPSREDQP